MELVYADNFYSDEFPDEDIPDDFFQSLAKRYEQDESIVVAKIPVVMNDVVSSVIMQADFYNDTMNCGPRESIDPLYTIQHDIGNVDPVFDWYEKFERGIVQDFPFFPPSAPVFPPKALKEHRHYRVQKIMMFRGFSLVNPSYGDIQNCATFGRFFSEFPKTSYEEIVSKIKKDDKLFYSYTDYYKEFSDKIVGMQFNPFHPKSITYIKSIHQKKKKFYGIYVWNNKEFQFDYDLEDKRYRLHSDVWRQQIDMPDYFCECFDLVGSYDFIDDILYDPKVEKFVTEDMEFIDKRKDDVPPIFLEPFFSVRQPEGVYSVIGPWEGKISLGIPDKGKFYVPYITTQLDPKGLINDNDEKYMDITQLCSMKNGIIDVRRFCDLCKYSKTYDSVYRCQCDTSTYRMDRSKLFKTGDEVYVRDYGDEISVFYPDSTGSLFYRKFKGRLMGCPYDGKNSLVYSYRLIPIVTMLSVDKKKLLQEFIQLTVMFPADLVPLDLKLERDYVEDVSLTEDDIQHLDLERSTYDECFGIVSAKSETLQAFCKKYSCDYYESMDRMYVSGKKEIVKMLYTVMPPVILVKEFKIEKDDKWKKNFFDRVIKSGCTYEDFFDRAYVSGTHGDLMMLDNG